jgi:dUTP pyrophosphatase
MNEIYFAKVNPNAKMPTKREEDAAVDLYACFSEPTLLLEPFTSKLVPTGIASAFSQEHAFIFYERGYTGVRNLKVNAGVIDSGFRGEWFVCLYNANRLPVIISKLDEAQTKNVIDTWRINEYIHFPYSKAIAQALYIPIKNERIEELSYEELKNFKSERMDGMIGSSNK